MVYVCQPNTKNTCINSLGIGSYIQLQEYHINMKIEFTLLPYAKEFELQWVIWSDAVTDINGTYYNDDVQRVT